jgi:hypothetical protein
MLKFLILTAIIGAVITAPVMAPEYRLADKVIEGCTWDDDEGLWEYSDGSPCRGTGEDPTTDGYGSPACAHGIAIPGPRTGTVACVR